MRKVTIEIGIYNFDALKLILLEAKEHFAKEGKAELKKKVEEVFEELNKQKIEK